MGAVRGGAGRVVVLRPDSAWLLLTGWWVCSSGRAGWDPQGAQQQEHGGRLGNCRQEMGQDSPLVHPLPDARKHRPTTGARAQLRGWYCFGGHYERETQSFIECGIQLLCFIVSSRPSI